VDEKEQRRNESRGAITRRVPGATWDRPPPPLPSSSTPPTPLIPSVNTRTTGRTLNGCIYRSFSQAEPVHACTTTPAIRHHDQLQDDA
jgi:hypothetical protein